MVDILDPVKNQAAFLKSLQESDIYKQWTKNCNVTHHIINGTGHSVLVVVKEDENTYSMYRFFPFGFTSETANWQVSADCQNTTADGLLDMIEFQAKG